DIETRRIIEHCRTAFSCAIISSAERHAGREGPNEVIRLARRLDVNVIIVSDTRPNPRQNIPRPIPKYVLACRRLGGKSGHRENLLIIGAVLEAVLEAVLRLESQSAIQKRSHAAGLHDPSTCRLQKVLLHILPWLQGE